MNYDEKKYIYGLTCYLEVIEKYYSQNLKLQIGAIMPLWDSESRQLMAILSKEVLLNKKINSDYMTREVVRKTCGNEKQVSKDDVKRILTKFIQQSEMILYEQYIQYYSRESLIILQQILDYNFFLSMVFIDRNDEKLIADGIEDKLARIIIESIVLNKKFGKGLEQELVEINNILAYDKQAIQKGICFINYYMPKDILIKNEQEVQSLFREEQIVDLLNIVRMLYKFYTLLDMFMSDNDINLSILKGEVFVKDTKYKENFRALGVEEYEKMIKYSINREEKKWLGEHDIDIKRFLGLNLEEIDTLLKQINAYINDGFSWILFKNDELGVVFKGLKVETKDMQKFCSYFVLEKKRPKQNSAFGHEKSSIKPILKYGENICYTTTYMLQIGIMRLLADIVIGQTANDELNKIIQKKVHEDRRYFENEVVEEIKKLSLNIKIKRSVTNVCGEELPGEIDIICLFQNVAYILECKAVGLKYTMKEEQNFIRNFTKGGKSFCGKMDGKLKFLRENIELLEKEFDDTRIDDIQGAFVIKYPSHILEKRNLPFPVVHISHVDEIFGWR